MSLPTFNTTDRIFAMMQDQWSTQLDPVLANPLVAGRLIRNVSLLTGDNTINTLLSRKLQGWIIVGQTAVSSVFDKQATNAMSDKTLILNASAPVTVSLWVF